MYKTIVFLHTAQDADALSGKEKEALLGILKNEIATFGMFSLSKIFSQVWSKYTE